MGMNLSEEKFLGGFREDEVPEGWYRGFEYDWWVALCIEWGIWVVDLVW